MIQPQRALAVEERPVSVVARPASPSKKVYYQHRPCVEVGGESGADAAFVAILAELVEPVVGVGLRRRAGELLPLRRVLGVLGEEGYRQGNCEKLFPAPEKLSHVGNSLALSYHDWACGRGSSRSGTPPASVSQPLQRSPLRRRKDPDGFADTAGFLQIGR